MGHFRRAPEWDQHADRHTVLHDPVLTVRQLPRSGFVPHRHTRIDHALVFSARTGEYTAWLPPLRPSRTEIIRNRYTAVYEVDMGVHPVHARLALPSSNDALEFEAAVELAWQVGDPAVFVRTGHRDVPRLLLNELEQAARPATRHFSVAKSADAEEKLLRAARAWGALGHAAGLLVTWTLRLHRDAENVGHQRRMQAIEHAAAERILDERWALEHDVEVDRRTRQQDALHAERVLAQGLHQQKELLQQQQWRAELRQAELEKIDFYQSQLEQGGVRAWALHLSEHPEDSRLVMNSLRDDQVNMIRAKVDMVTRLLSDDGAEGYELAGPKDLALRALSDILNQQLPGTEHGPAVPRLPVTEWPPGETVGTVLTASGEQEAPYERTEPPTLRADSAEEYAAGLCPSVPPSRPEMPGTRPGLRTGEDR
ncbi:hypothetical protein ABZY45_07935 [Streptomyces sp. NPDC006516]|uniref:hypothetical protein n=1 Tax=Streptomyces sp. NPDC006516 TaxID=3154309 RepID=UPI0033BE0F9B